MTEHLIMVSRGLESFCNMYHVDGIVTGILVVGLLVGLVVLRKELF